MTDTAEEIEIPEELAAPHTTVVESAGTDSGVFPATTGTREAPASRSGAHALVLPRSPFLDPSVAPGFQEFSEKWLAEVIPMVESKAREYGSNSLRAKGDRYARAQGRAVPQAEALELACFQYLAEKLDRVEDAALRNQPASGDTLKDLAVYALMALYIRQTGHWL
jgi:hypothetical protein